jgi:hypothetical protein
MYTQWQNAELEMQNAQALLGTSALPSVSVQMGRNMEMKTGL